MQQPSILPSYSWELRMHLSLACLLACLRSSALTPGGCWGDTEGVRPFPGHFCAHGALHSCAACRLSEHHSNHGTAASTISQYKYRLQILPYLSKLLQQAIPHLSAARSRALKQ